VEGCAVHFSSNDAVDAFECSVWLLETALPDRHVQILEAPPVVCVLPRLGDVDGVQEVIVPDVKAVQVTKVDQIRLFEHSWRRGRGRVGAPRRGMSEMLHEDTLAAADV
jgi:hypothetical protein